MRTLVLHSGGIGDFLLTCPALSKLEGPIELVGYKARLQLAVDAKIAIAAHNLETIGFESIFTTPDERLSEFMGRFQRAIIWMNDKDGRMRLGLEACGIATIEIHPGLPPQGWKRHASEYYAECLCVSGGSPFRLKSKAHQQQHDVIIHPGSGSPTKNWPIEHYLELSNALKKRGRGVEWILGPAERENPALLQQLASKTILTDVPLVEQAQRLQSAQLYIGNDSGITHLAAVAGCETIALFRATDPNIWAPLGKNVTVVAGAGWPNVDTVTSAIFRAS